MRISDADIVEQLKLGEASRWEFKRIEFRGRTLVSPSRENLADELGSFANSTGCICLCGVTGDGLIQDLSRDQMVALNHLLGEASWDTLNPSLRIAVYHRELEGKKFVLVEVPQSHSIHERAGNAYIRETTSKHQISSGRKLRLAQNREKNRYLAFDRQTIPEAGFGTLSEELWETLLSIDESTNPRVGLRNMSLLASSSSGIDCATVAGVLLCTRSPHHWLPQATIMATHFRGLDRTAKQLDSQEIVGPLHTQIYDAVGFVVRNMRVAARKRPGRENMPQYSTTAVFEAVVNAVAHRDYSMTQRRIRLSMFEDRLEIESPGQLSDGMTIEGMALSQSTRNEVIASVFRRIPVGSIAGSNLRQYLMDRSGYGVSTILNETYEIAGALPEYKLINQSSLVLTIPAAKLELCPAEATVTVHSNGEPIANVQVLVIFPNKTWQQATTNESGEANFDLYTTDLPMKAYAAVEGYTAGIDRGWIPRSGGLLLEISTHSAGGAAIFPQGIGQLPGLQGRINSIRDAKDRIYLYADNIAVDEGRQQPVPFSLNQPLRLTDSQGVELELAIVDIVGQCSLVEYRKLRS